jgi:hypothetical protein
MATSYIKAGVASTGVTGIAGTQLIDPGTDDLVSSCVFQVANLAGSFSTIPRITLRAAVALAGAAGAGAPLVTGTNAQYINLASGAVSAAGTAITANGIYAVYCPACQVELISSAGTADVFVNHVAGRVF